MGAPKNYSVPAMVGKEDETEIAAILAKYPHWKRKHARELIARRRFAERIKNGQSVMNRIASAKNAMRHGGKLTPNASN